MTEMLALAALLFAQQRDEPVTFAQHVAPILQAKCQVCHQPGSIDRTFGIQDFKNDRSLSDEQIKTIVEWVDAGAPLGDPKDLPPPVEWPDPASWRLAGEFGEPDLVVRSVPYTVKPEGQDKVFPEDAGKLMLPGAKIRWEVHYYAVGEEIKDDVVELGVWFYPKGYQPKNRTILRMFNAAPGSELDILSMVSSFQWRWHVNYIYADHVAPLLPKGTTLVFTAWHDNTTANSNNPDPQQWVGWGDRTVDEMAHAWVDVTYLEQEDYQRRVAERRGRSHGRAATGESR